MTSSNFKDHFSTHSDNYKRYRPGYPLQLLEFLAGLCEQRHRVWDCATGTGQAAHQLAKLFDEVYATDASQKQIEQAVSTGNIHFSVMPAEYPEFDTETIDLITVAQAFHWFDQSRFYRSAYDVLKPNGILAIWSYNLLSVQPDIDSIIQQFYAEVIGEYWPAERKFVEQGYPPMPKVFRSFQAPLFSMQTRWHLGDLLGYVSTWSACKYYREDTGDDPIEILEEELADVWQDPLEVRQVSWPLRLMVGRKSV